MKVVELVINVGGIHEPFNPYVQAEAIRLAHIEGKIGHDGSIEAVIPQESWPHFIGRSVIRLYQGVGDMTVQALNAVAAKI